MQWKPIDTVPMNTKGESTLLKTKQGLVFSGKKRYGNRGEPQQDVYAWRADCCGRFTTPTHWKELE